MTISTRASCLLLVCCSSLLAGPAQAGSNWLTCTFAEPTPTEPGKLVRWQMKSQEAKKSVEFISSTGKKSTLNAIYTPSQILFVYPKAISRDVSIEVEFRLNRQTLDIKKQVSNEPTIDAGSCAFIPAL